MKAFLSLPTYFKCLHWSEPFVCPKRWREWVSFAGDLTVPCIGKLENTLSSRHCSCKDCASGPTFLVNYLLAPALVGGVEMAGAPVVM